MTQPSHEESERLRFVQKRAERALMNAVNGRGPEDEGIIFTVIATHVGNENIDPTTVIVDQFSVSGVESSPSIEVIRAYAESCRVASAGLDMAAKQLEQLAGFASGSTNNEGTA